MHGDINDYGVTRMTVSILGTNYKILMRNRKQDKTLESADGYCDFSTRTIVIWDRSEAKEEILEYKDQDAYIRLTKRHEIIHAFLNESGLDTSSLTVNGAWARNEEMVDWLALQFPKIQAVFAKVGCDK